jgi:hypothetical protein
LPENQKLGQTLIGKKQRGSVGNVDYKMYHRPMTEEGGAARLHDLTKSFGQDIYGKNALQYFGSGDPREAIALKILQRAKNNPEMQITIYRGAPKTAKNINDGDWVTLVRSVAEDYGPNVLSKKVKAKDVTSWADSLLEFGYMPKDKP